MRTKRVIIVIVSAALLSGAAAGALKARATVAEEPTPVVQDIERPHSIFVAKIQKNFLGEQYDDPMCPPPHGREYVPCSPEE